MTHNTNERRLSRRKSLRNLAKWCNGSETAAENAGDLEFNSVWMDSRKLKAGDVFVALKGEPLNGSVNDGHDYVKQAFENGAVAAIVEKNWYEENADRFVGNNFIAVENPLAAIQTAARQFRRALNIPVIAITGSNGKTSTANILKTLLGKGFTVGGTKGNFNNDIGVPLSILGLSGSEEMAVFEIGANHAGEIAKLTGIIEPDMGIITNIGFAHIGLFGSIEQTAEAKFELARALSFNQGILLLNGDDVQSVRQNEIDRVPAFYFGLEEGNQIRAKNLSCNEFGCYSFDFNNNRYELSMAGIHCVYSVLPALYLCLSMGISRQVLQAAVRELKPASMRGEIQIVAGRKIIADCYNANPSSMKTSLRMFNDIPTNGGERIAVLGTMGELGDYVEEQHIELGKSLVNFKIQKLIAVGDCAKFIAEGAKSAGFIPQNIFTADSAIDAGNKVREISQENDLILFKGSRTVGLEAAIEQL